MRIDAAPYSLVDWSHIEPTRHPGETGFALWRTIALGSVRVRMVDYSPGYKADHWCEKGHVILCVAGEIVTELRDGRRVRLAAGQSYTVGDGVDAHRSETATGARLFIVD